MFIQLCTQCLDTLMSVKSGCISNRVNLSGFLLAISHHLRQWAGITLLLSGVDADRVNYAKPPGWKAPCHIMPHTIYNTSPLTSRAGIMLIKNKKHNNYLRVFIILFIEMYILHNISTIILHHSSHSVKEKQLQEKKKNWLDWDSNSRSPASYRMPV